MPGEVATASALLLYGLGLAPCIGFALRLRGARVMGSIATVALLAIALFSTGILQGNTPAQSEVSRLLRTIAPEDRCQEVFQLLLENRVLLERPDAERLVVNSAVWDQLPPPVRDAVEDCARTMSQNDRQPEPFEVIRR